MADVAGNCDPRFDAVRAALAANLDSGADLGASVAVAVGGDIVVDLWGGFTDESRTMPWQRDTLVNVWSTTKTMTALCALILADRGDLDFGARVSTYWPEFKAAGKETVEVRHLMSHSSGLAGWTEPIRRDDLYDWEKVTDLLARQEPWWEPGSASGYHAVTQGYLVGEVVRRITGQSLGTFLRTEVAEPLGADFHIGLAAADDARVAALVPPPSLEAQLRALPPDNLARRTFSNPVIDPRDTASRQWRAAEIPAANGHGHARSVVTIQSVLTGRGEARGTRLLSAAGCDPVFVPQTDGRDLVLRIPIRFGMGYGLGTEALPLGPRTCFWGGWGGSIVLVDQDLELTVAYVMNRMESGLVGDDRGIGVVQAAVVAALSGA